MKTRFSGICGLSLLFCLEAGLLNALQLPAAASPTAPDKNDPVVEAEAVFTGMQVGEMAFHFASIDAGTLDAGKRYRILAALKAETLSDVEFDCCKSSCACVNVRPTHGTITSGGVFPFEFTIQMPSAEADPEFRTVIELLHRNRVVGRVTISAQLSGNFYLPSHRQFIVSPGSPQFDVPVLFTAPITPDDIEIDASQFDPRLFSFELVRLDQNCVVRLTADPAGMDQSFYAGTLRLTERRRGQVRETGIVLAKKKPLTASPAVLQAFQSPEGAKGFRCTFLVQLSPELLAEHPDLEPTFGFHADGAVATISVRRIASFLYRGTIQLEPESDKLPARGKLVVTLGRDVFSSDHLIAFPH